MVTGVVGRYLIAGIFLIGSLPSQAQTAGTIGSASRTANTNIWHDDQVSWGNWDPVVYLEKGWTGYHIVADVKKERPRISYSCGDKCTHVYGPFCPDGDCKYESQTRFYRLERARESRTGYVQIPIGDAISRDDGSVETTDVKTPGGFSVAKILETEAQSRLGMEESQDTSFYTFDDRGDQRKLGHIEEADAPGIYNQTESVYDDSEGGSRFLTTVVEKILGNSDGTEGFRVGTLWCNSDQYKLSAGMMRLLYNDKYDFSKCTRDKKPFTSLTQNWLSSAFSGIWTGNGKPRYDSTNLLNLPNNPTARPLEYKVESKTTWFNGTVYSVNAGNRTLVHVDTDSYGNMGVSTPRNHYGPTQANEPKAKLIEINWGLERSPSWADGSKDYVKANNKIAALIAYDKVGELYTKLDGHHCDYDSGYFNSKYADPNLENKELLRRGLLGDLSIVHNQVRSSRVNSDLARTQLQTAEQSIYQARHADLNELRYVTCQRASHYTIHAYILFPPTVGRGIESLYTKRQILDAVLAALPDQSQSSPELDFAEDSLDKIRVLEKVARHNNNPSVVTLEDLVDINTEEDHLTAQQKVYELLSLIHASYAPETNILTRLLPEPAVLLQVNPNQSRRVRTE